MPVMQSPPGPETVIDGRRYLYFAGTGYLGLQGNPEVIRAACEAAHRFGLGGATSRAGFGDTPPVLDVEHQAARFFRAGAAFYFATGYAGPQILAEFLRGQFDAVAVDEAAHYAVAGAARATALPSCTFRHNDPDALGDALRDALQNHPARPANPLVMTDGVFSALGHVAPLADYVAVLNEGGFARPVLCVDDAHGVGVLGNSGRGTLEHAGLLDASLDASGINAEPLTSAPSGRTSVVFCATLSKAFGGFGGIVPGARAWIERLKTHSPYYRGASPPPPPAAAATARALELAIADPSLRSRLAENVRRMKTGLRRLGLPADDTPVPIVCLRIGTADSMQAVQQDLMARGIVIAYFRSYAGLGPEGALRLAVFATHTEAMIQQLLDALRQVL